MTSSLKLECYLGIQSLATLLQNYRKGEFIFPEENLKLQTEPFRQEGIPFSWRPQQTTEKKTKQKKSLAWRYLEFVNRIFNGKQKPTRNSNREDETDPDESELDMYMTNSGSVMFPTDPT